MNVLIVGGFSGISSMLNPKLVVPHCRLQLGANMCRPPKREGYPELRTLKTVPLNVLLQVLSLARNII